MKVYQSFFKSGGFILNTVAIRKYQDNFTFFAKVRQPLTQAWLQKDRFSSPRN
jgi:hypothetical protein